MAKGNWRLTNTVKSVLGAVVGWYGVPGRQGGNTHVLTSDGHVLCGHRPSRKAVFQNCGMLGPALQPECRRCQHILASMDASRRRDKKQNLEHEGLKVEPVTCSPKRWPAVTCRSFESLGPMLEKLFVDDGVIEVRVKLRW